jgi:limonene-1,2-epoxide hydrolase
VSAVTPIDTVTRFCAAWSRLDLDELLGFFAPDAVYHNIPVDPVVGHEAIRALVEGFTAGIDRVEFEVRHIAAAGDVVLTERIDRFIAPGREVVLPVMGTFEVRDGLITAWRDYFDLNQYMSQMAG